MEPLSTLGLGAAMLEFIQYTDEQCRIFNSFYEEKYNDFYEGNFVDMTRHFMYFAAVFKSQRPNGSRAPAQQGQEVSRRHSTHICTSCRLRFCRHWR